MEKERSTNWAHRRKLALEKLGDNLLRSAEQEAILVQQRLNKRLREVIESEFYRVENQEIKEAVVRAFLKQVSDEKAIAATTDLALEKISKQVMMPINPM